MKELIKQLNEVQQKYQLSDSVLCGKIGIHLTELNHFRNDTCGDHITTAVKNFIDKASQNIYPTKLLKVVHKVLKTVFIERELAVITSNSGAGKTTAIEQFAIENHSTVHIRVTEVITTKYLLVLLSKALHTPYIGLTKQQLFENINESLSRQNKLIVIDEAERLEVNQLELLRDLYDNGTIGLCLVGLESLTSLLQRGRSLKENLVQLYSRVGYKKVVDILEPDDVRMIFADKVGKHKISDQVIRSLAKKLENRGGLRAILKLSNLINKNAAANKITPDDSIVELSLSSLAIL